MMLMLRVCLHAKTKRHCQPLVTTLPNLHLVVCVVLKLVVRVKAIERDKRV
jgi:hypothetical protein